MSKNNAVEFRHVSFTYSDTEKPVLNDINFKIRSGSWTALIMEVVNLQFQN